MDKKLMEKYAEFIVKVGVNVGPGQTQNPEEFVTEVCYPIKKK